jgi:hypothetical protein
MSPATLASWAGDLDASITMAFEANVNADAQIDLLRQVLAAMFASVGVSALDYLERYNLDTDHPLVSAALADFEAAEEGGA